MVNEVPRYEDHFTPDGQLRHPQGVRPRVPLRRQLANLATRDLPAALSAIPAGRAALGFGLGARTGAGLARNVGAVGGRGAPAADPVLRGPIEIIPDVAPEIGRLQAFGARLATELGGMGARFAATQESRRIPRRDQEEF